MQEGYWMIRKYRSGPVGETIKFWVPGKRPDRVTRQMQRDLRKMAQNRAGAIREASRILNENYREGDGLVTLGYDKEAYANLEAKLDPELSGAEREDAIFRAAAHQAWLYIRRLRDHMRKDGLELRAFVTTSDRDWDEDREELVTARIHHHIIVNEEAQPYIDACWKRGSVDWRTLSAQPDYTPVATYLLQQVRGIPNVKKFRTTRNLKHPAPADRLAPGGAELRPPRGAVLVDRGAHRPGQPQYIRYVLPDGFEDEDMVHIRGILQVPSAKGHRRPREGGAGGAV